MTSVKKNGNISTSNLYEYKSMSIFVDENGNALQDSVTYTPTTSTNSCMPERRIAITPNVKYYIECRLTWNGFSKTNSDGNTFNMWFQGSQNNGLWSYNNAMTVALGVVKNPRELVLSATSGTYVYKTSFTSTDTAVTNLGLSMRSDYSNGTAWVTLSNVIVIPDKYYVDLLSSNTTKTKFQNTYISCNEIIEN